MVPPVIERRICFLPTASRWISVGKNVRLGPYVTQRRCQGHIPSLKHPETNGKKHLENLMVGMLASFWARAYFQVRTVRFREG